MTLTEHKIWHMPLILLALWLGACSMQYEDFDEPSFIAPGDITLVVNVHTGDRNIKATRADNNDGVSFEPTTLDREKINTLRVIIVKKSDGLIVHNDYRDLTTTPAIFVNGLKYRVEYDTEYTVYLIGNEVSLPDDERSEISETALKPGDKYTDGTLENIKIGSSETGSPMITGSATPIPMTEFFPVKTMTEEEGLKVKDDNDIIQNETFFITRAASKFSFYFFRAEDFTVDANETWTINRIKVSGLGQSEYLFPNATEYFPTKESDRVSYNRDIKAFRLPEADTYQTGDHTFTLPTAFNVAELPVKTGTDPVANLTSEQLAKCQLIPEMYFPESKGTGYTGTDAENQEYHFDCTISFGNEDFLEAVKLPNLPHALPRNTHVVVIVTIHDRYITATVDVIPFTKVLVTTSDYGLEREEYTGYVVSRDESGNITHWYDTNYYEPIDENDPPVKYYLGPIGHEGELVTINGKEYMLVYSDNGDISGSERKAANLDHIFTVLTKKDEKGNEIPYLHKYMLSPEARTGYQVVKDMQGFNMFLNNLKQKVWLDEDLLIKCYRTLNEWDRLTFAQCQWGWADQYPKAWFDILGNRYKWSEGETPEKRKEAMVDKIGEEWIKYLE